MSKRLPRKRERNYYALPNPRRSYCIMSPEELASRPKEDYTELEITGEVCYLSLSLFQMTHLTVLYLNNNQIHSLPGEISLLINLAHLNVSHNKLRTLPSKIGNLLSLRELILSHNFLSSLPFELGKLFKLCKLDLTGNLLNGRVLEILNNPSFRLEDLLNYLVDNILVPSSHPPARPWIKMAEETQPHCLFTVMCYNILCDKYATRQMYGYCQNWALDWSYRKKLILQEILHYKADIISLQEVETEQFYKYFLPELKEEGYDGIFSPKSRAKTMSECDRKHVDGCAIFYKTNKFTLVREHLMEFNQLAMANAEGCDDMLNRVMPKDNIGLAALLQTKIGAYQNDGEIVKTSQHILVCTAHIHWDPEYSDVKLIQMMMLMRELKTFVDDILQKSNVPGPQKLDPNIIPLLLCGDFNSLPDSGVIEYLSSGRVSTRHCDFKEYVYKDCLLGNTSRTNEFSHPFKISRAYNDGIMSFTNYSHDFKGVIDYVFFSKLHMSVCGVLGPIDNKWLEENNIQGCPHPHIPSDHFPIVVELNLNPTLPIHLSPPNGIVPLRR